MKTNFDFRTSKVFLALVVIAAALSLRAAPNLIGMNAPSCLDWEGSDVFADAFRSARDWEKVGGGTNGLVKDANGWPRQDAEVVVCAGATNMAGTYKFVCNGKADITLQWTSGSIVGKTYDATTDTTTASITIASDTTLRLLLSNTSNGVRNVRLWRAGYLAGTNMFTDRFKKSLARYSVIRFMDWLATNWNQDQRWSDRLTPNQFSAGMNKPGYGWQGRGQPLELAIQLANELHKDAWVCLPSHADDTYVRNFALVLRDGTNGYAGLDPGLNLYVEFANEVWNGGFEQAQYNYTAATNEVALGGSPLNFDGEVNMWYWAWRRVAKRGAEISVIFREVFGDAAMLTRIRPVLMTQQGNAQDTLCQALTLMEGYYNNPEKVATPHPASYYFYGAGGSGYYSPDNSSDALTLDNIWTNGQFAVANHTNTLIADAKYAIPFGLKRICYEGGPSLDNTGHSEAVKAASVNDPRMRAKVVEQHDAWTAFDGDLFVYFTLVAGYQWGFTPYVSITNTPKLQAIDDLNATSAAAIAYGTLLPATNEGNRFSCYYISWNQPGASYRDFVKGAWAGYVTRVENPSFYRYTVRASAAAPASFEFSIDGVSYGTFAVPANGLANPTNITVGGAAHGLGTHSYRITGRSGTNRVQQIFVDAIPEPVHAGLLGFALLLGRALAQRAW